MSAITTSSFPVTPPEVLPEAGTTPAPVVASVLDWPPGLRPTTLRQAWFDRFRTLEAGLSLKQVAERLSEPYASAAFWAKCFNYPFTKLARGRKSNIDWDNVDWSLKNCELARQLGVTGERVRQIRLARNLPPTQRHSDGGKQFRAFVAANRRRLHRWSIRQMIVESGRDHIHCHRAHDPQKNQRPPSPALHPLGARQLGPSRPRPRQGVAHHDDVRLQSAGGDERRPAAMARHPHGQRPRPRLPKTPGKGSKKAQASRRGT